MKDRFWTKSYDPGVTDLDPAQWETSYVEIVKPVFKKYPDKAAFVFMGVEVTFEDLDRYANRFAHFLLASGLKKGDVVGINLPNIPEYVIAWLGILRAGCVVSGVSPLLSAEQMKYQLRDSNARGLVTLDVLFAGRLLTIISDLPDLKCVVSTSVGGFLPVIKRVLGQFLKKIPKGKIVPLPGRVVRDFRKVVNDPQYSDDHPDVKIIPDDVAYIQYTGGTTGYPKGAVLSHRNVVSDLLIVQRWLGWEVGKGRALSGFPFFHIAGMFFNENCIYLGWTQILIPNPRNTDHICKELARHRPTALVNVPSLYQMLIANPKFRELDHSNLERCLSAAAPFPEDSQRELEDIIGQGKLLEVYGMTETSPLTTMNPSKGKKKLGSIGLPLINTDIKLVDPGSGEVVAVGEAGEICVKGPQIMIGYYNKPEETQLVFDQDGYLHTGDVAIQDERGFLTIVDRTKDTVIVGGFKVFSQRVEEVMTEHPAVDMIALIGVPNPERPGSELVKALVTIKSDYQFDGDEDALKADILTMARDKLAPYEVPKLMEIRKDLPLTSVGKVDKTILRKEIRKKSQ
ncbi:MAG: AMP-binding protein [Deltaproteobacteria bacterium]|nr:AMP-binding protein [Deltaproteobacteria bacterium]MBN2845067.1 AMP-binding protein [Deltaproteobacteria bacterium]